MNTPKNFFISILALSIILSSTTGYLAAYYAIKNEKSSKISDQALGKINGTQVLSVMEESATVDVVNTVSPAVVSIHINKEVQNTGNSMNGLPFDNFWSDFFGFPIQQPQQQTPNSNEQPQEPQKERVGAGTGFIISEDGLILTNKHVVTDDTAEYVVQLKGGKEYTAEVLARDPINDLAIVKIHPDESLPTVELGDSDAIDIGQTVIAIGFSLGEFNNSVTRGVVSGMNRKITAADGYGRSEVIEEAIQTDAAINPGNSGGPLLNLAGQVIAINTAVSQQGQSVGFAIPINVAKRDIQSVQEFGKIRRAYLGVRYVMINDQIKADNQIGIDHGALVLRGEKMSELAVVPGSPADIAGIMENDVILEVNGESIGIDKPLVKMLAEYSPGDKVTLKIYRKGDEVSVDVTLGEFDE